MELSDLVTRCEDLVEEPDDHRDHDEDHCDHGEDDHHLENYEVHCGSHGYHDNQ